MIGQRVFRCIRYWNVVGLLPAFAIAAVFQTAPGRFEVTANNATEARAITAAADEAWKTLASPLSLPESFSSPVFVRIIAAGDWPESAPFRTIVEAGGVVSLRIRGGAAVDRLIRRALAQALLMRLAVAQHGVHPGLTAPLWLEQAAVTWWETRIDGAQFDAIKQESEQLAPPRLVDLLRWQRGEPETRAQIVGAFWLMTFLQAEATGTGEWRGLLRRLLGGEDALSAIALVYPGRFNHETERELWWQTGHHHVRRVRALPALRAAESRRELEVLARFVVETGERDVVAPMRAVLAQGSEAFIGADLQRRVAELNRLLPALHPFYRNAGLSLAEALAARTVPAAKRGDACAAFERDWRDALEIEAATMAALDALERK